MTNLTATADFLTEELKKLGGWVVPAYTMAPNTDKMKMMRIVIREDFSRCRCGLLIKDMKLCCHHLEQDGKQFVKRMESHYEEHTEARKDRASLLHNGNAEYQNEYHSLSGKAGKSNPVC
ncbi:hypothetical protein PWT90_05771 [Aphanocladium album]|nr:hypothetical protein PWT90_05771 [Aphanocladium album]